MTGDVAEGGDTGAERLPGTVTNCGARGGFELIRRGITGDKRGNPLGEVRGVEFGGRLIGKFQMGVGVDEAGEENTGVMFMREIAMAAAEIREFAHREDSIALNDDAGLCE